MRYNNPRPDLIHSEGVARGFMASQVPLSQALTPPMRPVGIPPGGPIRGAILGLVLGWVTRRSKDDKRRWALYGAAAGGAAMAINMVRVGRYQRDVAGYEHATGTQCRARPFQRTLDCR